MERWQCPINNGTLDDCLIQDELFIHFYNFEHLLFSVVVALQKLLAQCAFLLLENIKELLEQNTF